MNIIRWYSIYRKWRKIYRNLKSGECFYILPKHIVMRYYDFITVIGRYDLEEYSNKFSWRNFMWIRRNIEPNPYNWAYAHKVFLSAQLADPNKYPNFLKGIR